MLMLHDSGIEIDTYQTGANFSPWVCMKRLGLGAIPQGPGAIPQGPGAIPQGPGAIPQGPGAIPQGLGAYPTGPRGLLSD